jgi:hypothetical protein
MMKNALFFPFILLVFTVIFLAGFNIPAMAYPSGSPAGYTGSPGDAQSCKNCHGGTVVTVNNWITSNIPPEGYTPGTVYTVTVTVTGTGKKGFEVSPQSSTGTQLGTLTAGTSNHLVGGTKYVTQNSGNTAATATWSFTWTAPAAGTGPVTFYGAFTVGEPNTKLSTLVVSENSALPLSATATADPSTVCAGQTTQLNATASGGSGSYTYQWSSVPAGFTSNLQNPVVTPSISTQYSVVVSDGTGSTSASTNVTVNQSATAIAGNDTTCAYITSSIPLSGIAANYSSSAWTTTGTGSFTAPSALTGAYIPSVADKDAGVVELTLTAIPQSPCTASAVDSRIIHFDAPTGLSDNQVNQTKFMISPNPSDGLFTLHVSSADEQAFIISVKDVTCKEVLKKYCPFNSELKETVNLAGSPKGIYFVHFQNDHFSEIRKVIIK